MHRNHLIEYKPEEETLPPMIEEYKNMCLWIAVMTIFLWRFVGQRIQKLNNPEQAGMEDTLPFPIEPLRTAPVTLSQK